MAEVLSDREQQIIDLVVQALPQHLVMVTRTNIHTLEGGESSTLSFTANDVGSTDLKRDRIATGGESAESLAREVEGDLLQQLGATAR